MARKIQVPSVGGLRKVIAGTAANTATTIQGLEGQSITLQQLALALGTIPVASPGTSSSTSGGSGSTGGATLVLGPGLSGGGALLGNVSLRLTATIPYLRRAQEGQRGRRGPPGQSGAGGGGGGGSLTVTDGTHAVAGVTQLTLSGTVVSGATPNATATISGGGGSVVNNFIMRRRQAEAVRGRRGAPGMNGVGGGASWSITDGTHSVSNVTSLTISGATVGGAAGAATLAVSGGGSSIPTAVNVNNLQYWFDASQVTGPAGQQVPVLQNFFPQFAAMSYLLQQSATNGVIGAQLNGKNTIGISTISGPSGYLAPIGPILHNSTVFIVFSCTNVLADQSIIGAASGGYSLQIDTNVGGTGGALQISEAFVSVSGQSTTSLTNNTWYQANATYSDSTGAYAFRVSRTAEGSGSYSATMSTGSTGIGLTVGYGQDFNGSIAEIIIYDRVLSSGEITAIETYLNTKWGV